MSAPSLSRRAFLCRTASFAAGLAGGAPAAAFQAVTGPAEPSASPPRPLALDSMTLSGPTFDARAAVAAGLDAVVADLRAYPRNFAGAVEALADWCDAFRRPDSGFLRVTRAADLDAAARQGRLGVILACQDGTALDSSTVSVDDRNMRNLRFFHELGLRVLQLTHNERNALGDSFRERSDAGLSLLGEKVVAEMNELGMLIDLSHCGDRTALEAIRLSRKPSAVTHAGCRAVFATGRNKSDETIRALADRGGYFGVFAMSVWLTGDERPAVDHVVDHLDHVVKIGGIEVAGFGSDLPAPGEPAPPEILLEGHRQYQRRNAGLPGSEREPRHVLVPELNPPDRLRTLAAALTRRGYKADAIDRITGGNFRRVFREVCG